MAIFNSANNSLQTGNKTLYEVVMIADQYGSPVTSGNPSGMAIDAFGRARVSNPVTLFDSAHRYRDNGKFSTSNTAGGTYSHDTNTSTVTLTVDNASGTKVVRESNRIFAYQPGKSLQILNTFVFDSPKENLRQRVGYFNTENGIYFQQSGNTVSFVVRSYSSGSLQENVVNQTSWNLDTLDGNGPSKLTLDATKVQIMFIDVEWLGAGTVRVGFVINGQLIHCHSFHHSNLVDSVYMTTACLPIRYEIENLGATSGSSTLGQICSSVISEGGYELRGQPYTIGTPIGTLTDIPTAGTYVPVVSIRLKSTRLDSIVVPKDISLLGVGNNTRLRWKIIKGGTLGGNTTFVSVDNYSSVEYNITANTITGGTDLTSGFVGITNQSATAANFGGNQFTFQLERNGLSNTATIFTLAATGAANGDDVLGSIDWDEIV